MENLPYLANITPFLERDKKWGDPLKAAPIAKKCRSSVAALGHFFMHAWQQIRLLQFWKIALVPGSELLTSECFGLFGSRHKLWTALTSMPSILDTCVEL